MIELKDQNPMILLSCSISLFLNMRKNILREIIRLNDYFLKIKGKKKEEEEEEKQKGRRRRMKRKRETS